MLKDWPHKLAAIKLCLKTWADLLTCLRVATRSDRDHRDLLLLPYAWAVPLRHYLVDQTKHRLVTFFMMLAGRLAHQTADCLCDKR